MIIGPLLVESRFLANLRTFRDTVGHILLQLVFASLWALLLLYFFYTIVAIIKGASYVPTTHRRVARLIDLVQIKPGEKLLDLGSGDGRILFAAATRGATCVGVEINPLLCIYSRALARVKGIKGVTIKRCDFWRYNLADVDILTVYLVPIRLDQLKAKVFAEMKSGTRVVTAVYHFDNWEPEQREGDVAIYRVP